MNRCWSFLLGGALVVASVQAQAVRTFVSTSGIDNAVCSRTNPCRTFGAAIDAVDPGGEVVALDSGGYGPFTVAKSVSVIAPPAVHAAIAPTAGTAITVDSPGIIAILIGLYLNGQGASTGISATQFAALSVDRCSISGFFAGFLVHASDDSSRRVNVSDTVSRNNSGGPTSHGFAFNDFPSDTTATIVTVTRSRAENNEGLGFGINGNTVQGTIVDSIASGNGTAGFAGQYGRLNLERCTSSANAGSGVVANLPGAVVRVDHSIVVDNQGAGFQCSSCAAFESTKTSLVKGNAPDISATITVVTLE